MLGSHTPKRILQRLNQDIVRTGGLRDASEKLATQGAQPMVMTPEAFDALIRSEVTKLGRLVRESGAGGG